MNALRAVQGNSEVGVPVGPHSAHLLAELVLAPFDEHMLDRELPYMRFVDDVHVACKSEDEAREVLSEAGVPLIDLPPPAVSLQSGG